MSGTRNRTRTIPDVMVGTRGEVPRWATEMARDRVAAALGLAPEPVLFARVRLEVSPDPAVARRATCQVNADVNGRLVRVQVAAAGLRESIDLAHDRLRGRLERIGRNWEAVRGARPKPGPNEWRHGAEPAHRPDYYPRPAAEREIVRHKAYALERQSVDEAVFDMDMMDYDFSLFTDVATGQDSVVYRSGDGYRLAQAEPPAERADPVAVPLTVSPQPAARLDEAEAIERLEMSGQPFVFFVDRATGRGRVLYHRYDGHYGLIVPVA
ncbi:sigma 54 modulation/S30EA ribosomal C-terminal domain-containing protein [Actinomadura viridis]|uniref:sigma 54 modulation/S30EA ribosomal C-terminal domain-containing protein n=1 Tax=Actinomadura viridis TaxID=58110 RepID=UPI0036B75EC5